MLIQHYPICAQGLKFLSSFILVFLKGYFGVTHIFLTHTSSLIPDVRCLFHPNPSHVASRSVHQKCLTLLLAQTIIGSPMKNFERYIESLTTPDESQMMPKRLEPIQKV